MRRLFVLFAALTLPVGACHAQPAATEVAARRGAPLELVGRVTDAANILSPDAEDALTHRSERLEHDTKVQFVVVSTPNLGGREIKDYSLALGNGWGIGDARRDDGVLLVVAPNERKVRIEVGLGLEKVLPDALCQKIVDDMLVFFKKGDLAGGVESGSSELDMTLRERLL